MKFDQGLIDNPEIETQTKTIVLSFQKIIFCQRFKNCLFDEILCNAKNDVAAEIAAFKFLLKKGSGGGLCVKPLSYRSLVLKLRSHLDTDIHSSLYSPYLEWLN